MSELSLFRQEAIEFHNQRQEHWGELALLQPLSIKILFWCIIAVVVSGIVFLFLAQYARKETVGGYLVPTAGIAKISVPRQGTIKAIHVEEGQMVGENQPL